MTSTLRDLSFWVKSESDTRYALRSCHKVGREKVRLDIRADSHDSREVPPTMIVRTSRLSLRLLTPADADFVIELVNDPAWLRYIGDRNIHDRASAEAYIEKCLTLQRTHGVGLLAVEVTTTGTVIGTCGLLKRDQYPDFDLGFAYLERHRRQGYAREAAAEMLRVGHQDLGRKRILALTDPANVASIKLLQGLGFNFESAVQRSDGSVETNIYVHVADAKPRE